MSILVEDIDKVAPPPRITDDYLIKHHWIYERDDTLRRSCWRKYIDGHRFLLGCQENRVLQCSRVLYTCVNDIEYLDKCIADCLRMYSKTKEH